MSATASIKQKRSRDLIPSTSAAAAAKAELNRSAALISQEGHRLDDKSAGNENKPDCCSFKQQNLLAWQPMVGQGVACPTLLVIAILCFPIGIGMWRFSADLLEKRIPYTDCLSRNVSTNDSKPCSEFMARDGPHPDRICYCMVNFTLPDGFDGIVYMYYELTHFYQNHRRYARSRDDAQLFGSTDSSLAECEPFHIQESTNKKYWPCGANARSMFQDKIEVFFINSSVNGTLQKVKLNRKGIAWHSDKEYKFKNPKGWNTPAFKEEYAQPESWVTSPWDLDPDDESNNGLQNEDLIVWMRIAAFPNFRKLYRIVAQDDKGYQKTMPKGDYFLNITYSFPVKGYNGTKSIIFATTSVLGGKNNFIGIFFVIIAILCLLMGALFFAINRYALRGRPRVFAGYPPPPSVPI